MIDIKKSNKEVIECLLKIVNLIKVEYKFQEDDIPLILVGSILAMKDSYPSGLIEKIIDVLNIQLINYMIRED